LDKGESSQKWDAVLKIIQEQISKIDSDLEPVTRRTALLALFNKIYKIIEPMNV